MQGTVHHDVSGQCDLIASVQPSTPILGLGHLHLFLFDRDTETMSIVGARPEALEPHGVIAT
jgi:hypothetical protein